jgi:hypothetical protein
MNQDQACKHGYHVCRTCDEAELRALVEADRDEQLDQAAKVVFEASVTFRVVKQRDQAAGRSTTVKRSDFEHGIDFAGLPSRTKRIALLG